MMFNSKAANQFFEGNEFLINPKDRKHFYLPDKFVSFDLETTGLDTRNDEPVSYGIAVYRNGLLVPHESHHFLVSPETRVEQKAFETHGWSNEALESSRVNGTRPKDKYGNEMDPAMDPMAGANRAAQTLANLQKQGFVMIGANHVAGPRNKFQGYDIPMLGSVYKKYTKLPLETSGFDPKKMLQIDVQQHEDAVDPESAGRKREDPLFRSRSLESLADHYGVTRGRHIAFDDATTTAEVLKKQIELNRYRTGMGPRTAAVGPSGIEYLKSGPCVGPDCDFCKHLDMVEETHKATGEGATQTLEQKHHIKSINTIRKQHKQVRKGTK